MNDHLSATTLWPLIIILGTLQITIGLPTDHLVDKWLEPTNGTPHHHTKYHMAAIKTHHHDKKFKPTPIPVINMTLVKEHYAIGNKDSVYSDPFQNQTTAEDMEKEMINLINTNGFDRAIKILEGRVAITLEQHPNEDVRARIRDTLMKVLFDYHTLHSNLSKPGTQSQQHFVNVNPEWFVGRDFKTTPRTTAVTTTQGNEDDDDYEGSGEKTTNYPRMVKIKLHNEDEHISDEMETTPHPKRTLIEVPKNHELVTTHPHVQTTTQRKQDDDGNSDEDSKTTTRHPKRTLKKFQNAAGEVANFEDDEDDTIKTSVKRQVKDTDAFLEDLILDNEDKKPTKRQVDPSDSHPNQSNPAGTFEKVSPLQSVPAASTQQLGAHSHTHDHKSGPQSATTMNKESPGLTTHIMETQTTTKFMTEHTHLQLGVPQPPDDHTHLQSELPKEPDVPPSNLLPKRPEAPAGAVNKTSNQQPTVVLGQGNWKMGTVPPRPKYRKSKFRVRITTKKPSTTGMPTTGTRKVASHSCPSFANFISTAAKVWKELMDAPGFFSSLQVVSEAVARSMKALGSCFFAIATDIWSYFYHMFQSDTGSSGAENRQINGTKTR